jgi:phosphohistidine phosphatase SixA
MRFHSRSSVSMMIALAAGTLVASTVTHGQALAPSALAAALRQGGLVLLVRHASAPRETPTKQAANPDNPTLERQLDEKGRQGATAMGEAIRRLRIPIGEVLTSPAYRARETVRLAQLPEPAALVELGDGGQSMQSATEAQGTWLKTRVAQPPRSGNTILVTHNPNLARAFPDWGASVAEGETVVLRPDKNGGAAVVGRITIDAWPRLR